MMRPRLHSPKVYLDCYRQDLKAVVSFMRATGALMLGLLPLLGSSLRYLLAMGLILALALGIMVYPPASGPVLFFAICYLLASNSEEGAQS